MLEYIKKILLSESKKIEEVFSAQDRRAYQREFDRIKPMMATLGLNPDN